MWRAAIIVGGVVLAPALILAGASAWLKPEMVTVVCIAHAHAPAPLDLQRRVFPGAR